MLKEIYKMKSGALLIALMVSALGVKDADAAAPGVLNSAEPDGKPHVFSFGGDKNESFMLDGKPFRCVRARYTCSAFRRRIGGSALKWRKRWG